MLNSAISVRRNQKSPEGILGKCPALGKFSNPLALPGGAVNEYRPA
jgi:hypothetical protein